MSDNFVETIKAAGVANENAEDLSSQVLNPAPGTFDAVELESASEDRIPLLASIVAAARRQQFGASLEQLLNYVATRTGELRPYDVARFWHLKGGSLSGVCTSLFTWLHRHLIQVLKYS